MNKLAIAIALVSMNASADTIVLAHMDDNTLTSGYGCESTFQIVPQDGEQSRIVATCEEMETIRIKPPHPAPTYTPVAVTVNYQQQEIQPFDCNLWMVYRNEGQNVFYVQCYGAAQE